MAGLPAGRVTNDPSNYFAFALQSAKDTDGTTFYFTKHLSGTGFDVAVDTSSERVGGSGREVGLRYRTKVTADGQVISYADPDFTGRVLYGALGTETVAQASVTNGVTVWAHTIVSGGSLLPYYTAEQAWADEIERTTNCQFSDVKLEGEAGHPVKVSAQFISGGTPHTQGTALSPTRESDPVPFMIPGGSVAITAVTNLSVGASLGGASSLQLTKWSLDIKNSMDDAIQTVALNREDVLWLTADYDLDGTVKYIDRKLWEAIDYGGGSQVPTGALTAGQFTFFTQTPSSTSLKLFAPYVEFTSVKVNRLDPDGKTMYLDFVGSTRGGVFATQSLQATVINGTSGSYTNPAT